MPITHRQVPKPVWMMLLANLVLVIASFFSPVQMWSANCSICASAMTIGVSTSFRKEPDNRVVRAILAAFFWLLALFALVPFMVYLT